ncbi:hypothetical protein RAS1_22910 [Phycisphaerae bacterium RAS1]|nr:hypothetical protein RAS1_22910 [Phycisphaerae bacterium RAS1]
MNTPRTRVVTGTVTLVSVAALAALIMGQMGSQPAAKDSSLSQRRVAAARLTYEQLVVEPPKSGEVRASFIGATGVTGME